MAKFKINLINLNNVDSTNTTYFKQPISEFYDQRTEYLSKPLSPKYSYCYTYNEKFSETTNSQKKLTFNMNRKITRDDRIEDNPFVYNIHVGSQILLEDKHDRHHLLTISDIKYDFKEFNLVYTYECQDSFTWQLSRQSDGYEIVNDPSSDDFIGARNLHDWTHKICSDCNVIYDYEHNKSLDNIKDFTKTIIFSGSGTADSMLVSLGDLYGLQIQVYEHFNSDNTITKKFTYVPLKSLSPSGLKYSPYHDIQSFGLSHNGTALSSVLNVKGGEVGNNIVSLIPSVPSFFRSWFTTDSWRNSKFVPGMFSSKCQAESKNILKTNIETIFNINSSNLLTLINLTSFWRLDDGVFEKQWGENTIVKLFKPVWNKEEEVYISQWETEVIYEEQYYNMITLVWTPKPGPNYMDYQLKKIVLINSNTSVQYVVTTQEKNIFQFISQKTETLLRQIELLFSPNGTTPMAGVEKILREDNKEYYYLYIYLGNFKLNPFYTHLRFQSQEKVSRIYCEEIINEVIQYSSHYNTDALWYLVNADYDSDNSIKANFEQIPQTWYSESHNYFVKIPYTSVTYLLIKEAEIYVDFYRNPTKEELEFARIADECPWLENRLFDFNYFYNHQIINRKQYQDLNLLIQNDLRQANAKLLLYSHLYYQELKNKTERIAKLESQIDTIGAIFNAEFIQPFNDKKPFESSKFTTAYSSLFRDINTSVTSIGLLDYAKTMSGYINKYIDAEQTFLKNMYLFSNYFNEQLEPNRKLYEYTIQIDEQDSNNELYTFSTPNNYTRIDADKFNYIDENGLPTISIYQKDDDNYCAISPEDLISKKSLIDDTIYYIEKSGNWTQVEGDSYYNADTQYFEKQWVYSIKDNEELDYYKQIELPAYDIGNSFELYRLDIWNKKAYIKSRNHIVREPPEAISFVCKDSNKTVLWNISKSDLSELYEPVDIYQLKCNYLYKQLTESSPSFAATNYHRVSCTLHSMNNVKYSIFNDSSKSNLLKFFKSAKNSADDSSFDTLYAENFPLTTLQFKDREKYYPVDFINFENAQNFYRRISVSNGWKVATRVTSSLLTLSLIASPIGFLVDIVANTIWKYGPTSWGTEGWTYQDVYGSALSLSQQFKSSWTHLAKDIYTKSSTAWNEIDENLDTRPSSWKLKYAQNIILTYNSLMDNLDRASNYYYQPYHWRMLSDDDVIDPNEEYLAIYATETDQYFNETYVQSGVNNRIDAIVNYPLDYVLAIFPTSDFDFEKNPYPTLETFKSLTKLSSNIGDGKKLFVFHKEDYDYETFEKFKSNKDSILSYVSDNWYDSKHKKIDWTTVSGLANGFFTQKQTQTYKPITNLQEINESNLYFKWEQSGYVPRYTLKQLISKNNTYIREGFTKKYYSFSKLNEISLPVNVYIKNNNNWEYLKTISKTFTPTLKSIKNLSSLTNGSFWATYINSIEHPVLMQEAMLIETNLTEYWTNAYYASKNCKYFIPEFWQPVVNGQINNFSSEIIINSSDNIKLLNTYIPTVTCTSGQPTLSFQYNDQEQHYNNATGYEYNYNSQVSVSSLYIKQPWLQKTMSYLGINDKQCTATILDYQSAYYNHISGGKTWYDMLNNVGSNSFISYKNFGGWYDMIIKVLNTKYISCSIDQYDLALEEHNRVWKQIYQTYPNLIYEKSFEYTDAVTSEQLLDAAKFAFRQYNDVERQYNIQTIDLAGLKGYQGQDLRIGDAIELDADELYDAYDDIKTSLLQYLYISDINYDLRSDANIQLTVNNIKYSDKVIGELVKLIR